MNHITIALLFAGLFFSCNSSVEEKSHLAENETIMEDNKKRVVGIGGLFYKSNDSEAARNWYQKHLGFNTDEYGTNFEWRKTDQPDSKGFTLWSPFNKSTKYFGSEDQQFMFNFRVENLEELVEELKKENVEIVDEIQSFDYGKFVHIVDLEGNRIELWEAFDDEYEKMVENTTTH